jgi:2-hydroxy-3-keto-5-methylthiopentenyl-1-phosphate phosphatase
MAFAFVCDFDGTVSPSDIGAAFIHRFRDGAADELASALARWRAGEIGHRELTEIECSALRASADEADAFARGFALDPEFAPFVSAALAAGHRVAVVSEGFDFYIADRLANAGLAHVPWSSNRVRFEGKRVIPEFPHAGRGCGRCGNCKGERVRDEQLQGRTVVFVGDGLSDRCGARAADRVFARGTLLEWCEREGIAAARFDDFADVAHATGLAGARATNGAARHPLGGTA